MRSFFGLRAVQPLPRGILVKSQVEENKYSLFKPDTSYDNAYPTTIFLLIPVVIVVIVLDKVDQSLQ